MKIAQVGEEVLRMPARKVKSTEFAEAQFQNFVGDMLAVMLEANGVGIAAPQVFDPRAIMIIASRPNPRYPQAPEMEPMALTNPTILASSQNRVWEWEGCLSVPGLRGRIERPDWVKVEYQNSLGEPEESCFEGFIARIFLHEFDHLIGKTWLDHISDTANIMANDVWMDKFERGELD